MAKITMKVDGMSCEHCVQAVTGAVESLPSISNAVVDLGNGTATVEYDPSRTTVDQIKAKIEDQGFEVTIK